MTTIFFLGTSIKDAGKHPTNFAPSDSTAAGHAILDSIVSKGVRGHLKAGLSNIPCTRPLAARQGVESERLGGPAAGELFVKPPAAASQGARWPIEQTPLRGCAPCLSRAGCR